VRLLVFGQVTGALELFVTARFTATFRCEFCRGGRALAASHGSQDRLVLFGFFAQRSLEANAVFVIFVEVNGLSSSDGDGLSVLLDSDEFSRATVLCESAVKFDFVSSRSEVSI
jgi:hypothetical protein